MAETTLSVQQMDLAAGLDVALAAANTDGSKFLNPSDERTFLMFENSNAATRTVTAETVATVLQAAGFGAVPLTDKTRIIPANTGKVLWGPFPAAQFNDSDGYCHVTYSAVAGLTVAAVRIARAAP